MEKTTAIHVQPNSRTTMGPATVCRFPGCMMPAMASPGYKSESLNNQLLVDSIPALIHTSRPDGFLDYFNKPWLEYLGVTLDKVTGWNWTAFVHPGDREGIVAKWRACLATGEIFEYETRVRRANGEYRWMFHRKVPLRDANGNIVKWYGSSLDIDERKTAEEELRRNSEQLQRSEFYLAEGQRLAHMGSWAFDLDGFYYWSPELFRMHGLDPAGKPPGVQEYLDCVHPHDRESMTELVKGILANASPFDATKRIVRPNGEVRYIRCVGVPVIENQCVKKYVGSALDVTEHELLTQDLRRREAYLAEGQRLSHTGSWAWNVRTNALLWSEEIFRIYGYSPQTDPTWERLLQRVHPKDRPQIEQRAKMEAAGNEWIDSYGDFRIVLPDGTMKYLHSVAHPVTQSGEVTEVIGTVMDVTEHELLTQELRRREAYLAEAQKLSHTGSFGWKPDTGEIVWSEETYRIFGYDRAVNPTIDSVVQRVHPEDRADFQKVIDDASGGATHFEHTYRLLLPGGEIKHVRALAQAFQDASGDLEFVGAVTDVTEQRHAEAVIREQEAELRGVLDSIPAMVWSTLPDGSNTYVNKRFVEYSGSSAEQTAGSGWQALIHPDDLERHAGKWMEAIATGKPLENEVRSRRSDGQYRWQLDRGVPLRDEDGNIAKWYGVTTDIEDRKRAEDKIREHETELRQILDFAPWQVAVLGADGKPMYLNKAGLDYHGLTREAWQDYEPHRLIHPDDRDRILGGAGQAKFLSDRPFEIEARLVGKDGKYRWFLFRLNPLRDGEGRITRWYVTGTDIEDRKQAEDSLHRENVALREEVDKASMFEEIVGTSPVLQTVLSRISKVAPSDSTVLITGETGTGKELVARAIHRRSNRASRAFVSVNCAAIPRDLIASELFGHEKGAFTGATGQRLGRFELANGGTIFLDEVGELPAETQIALLRVLQEHEFERVGGSRRIRADVRVIAATNRDLQAAISAGSFRSDLFYRLNVFPIEMPSLRERREDIPLLVEYFIDRYARKAGKKIERVNKKTLELLLSYAWPGNIRELQNVIERSMILCETEIFGIDENWLPQPPSMTPESRRQVELPQRLLGEEKDMIEAVLKDTRGRVSGPTGAAVKLGIPRSTLESKIRSLKIDKNRFRVNPGT